MSPEWKKILNHSVNFGLYGMGFLFEEPNPTGSRARDLIGLCKPMETPEGAERMRPKQAGGGRKWKVDQVGARNRQERVEEGYGTSLPYRIE